MKETKKVAKKKVSGNSQLGLYALEVSVNDVEYKGSAQTMEQALNDFVTSTSFPFSVKTRVLLKFSDGKREGSQRYSALMARRVFKMISSKPSALEIMARKMEAGMA